jgi:hypothetical protein
LIQSEAHFIPFPTLRYQYKNLPESKSNERFGFVAQDIQKIIPDFVKVIGDTERNEMGKRE